MYSAYRIARSASRMRCWITCFAVIAAMRPKSLGVTSVRTICCSGTWLRSRSRSSSETSVCCFSPVSSSIRSSSVIADSRASSSRRSSRSGGISIAKTRNSPSSSSSTAACREAPGVFLYAASSASSSACTSVSCSMPFSRSSARMFSMISMLMSYPSSIRLPRTISSYGMVSSSLAVRIVTVASPAATTSPRWRALPARWPRVRTVTRRPDGLGEVGRLAQRPLGARRRDVDPVVRAVAVEELGDALAEGVIDPARMVDVDAEAAAARPARARALRPRAGCARSQVRSPVRASSPWCRRQTFRPLHEKWAPRAHFAEPVKMVITG